MKRPRIAAGVLSLCFALAPGWADAGMSKAESVAHTSGVYIGRLVHCNVPAGGVQAMYLQTIRDAALDRSDYVSALGVQAIAIVGGSAVQSMPEEPSCDFVSKQLGGLVSEAIRTLLEK